MATSAARAIISQYSGSTEPDICVTFLDPYTYQFILILYFCSTAIPQPDISIIQVLPYQN